MEFLSLSDETVARRTFRIGTYIESQIKEKLINCEFFSMCLDKSTDINDLC